MKKYFFFFNIMLLSILLAACGGVSKESSHIEKTDVISVSLAHSLPESHFVAEAMEVFAREVNEKGEGRIQVDVFPSGQLYSDKEMMEAVTSGAVEIGLNNSPLWSGAVPSIDILSLPMIFDSYEHVHRSLDNGIAEVLSKDIENRGAYVISWTDYGFTSFAMNKEVRQPEELQGMKLRVHSQLAGEFLNQLGGSPVFMGGGDVDLALQRKTIDGASTGPTSMYSRVFHKHLNYAVKNVNPDFSIFILTINKPFFDSLPDDLQEIIRDAGKNAEKTSREEVIKEEAEDWKNLSNEGMNVLELTNEERQEWLEKAKLVWDDYINKVENGRNLVNIINQNR